MQETINNHLLCHTLSDGKGNVLLGCGGSCHRGTARVCQDPCFLCHLKSQEGKFIHPDFAITSTEHIITKGVLIVLTKFRYLDPSCPSSRSCCLRTARGSKPDGFGHFKQRCHTVQQVSQIISSTLA